MTNIEVQIQERGRITIPVNIRKRYGLKEGDWVTLRLIVDEQSGPTAKNPSLDEVTDQAAVKG